ncbi:guanine nucleotide binding protein alpha subunit [Protomyces lactucae-debilis]|uniref:Guanine nucleotide binding protein alpha subunit n=1 Tax=Protomyces lactucae-debilis TaxID=2754530 RepID=A0A1Y2EXQ7_PROLT|nr:guanine nucleotide binding protein alpha subunit [Protomyces lactucae-debilis]ORY76358.1 guanine nucleotide binding protein alpha subunit [Protomyces lactucae-debilis]
MRTVITCNGRNTQQSTVTTHIPRYGKLRLFTASAAAKRCASFTNCAGEAEYNRQINKELALAERKLHREVKILLLGAGESGKTTVLKQMRLIHASGFSVQERQHWRTVVFQNLLVSMRTMLEAMELLEVELRQENEDYIDLFLRDYEIERNEPLPAAFYGAMTRMWQDEGIQEVALRGNEYALHDNVYYFYNQLDALFAPDYIPSDQDILHCRLKTTGITETLFELHELSYRMFDVGGQRSERKKWIHCFEQVTAVLFLASLSGYDQCLVEDRSANQVSEALMLFDAICGSQWFVKTSMILFLNKMDLFRDKLDGDGGVSFQKWFPDWKPQSHGRVADEGMLFLQHKFADPKKRTERVIYSHFTNATDTTLLRSVMASVTDIILQNNLKGVLL